MSIGAVSQLLLSYLKPEVREALIGELSTSSGNDELSPLDRLRETLRRISAERPGAEDIDDFYKAAAAIVETIQTHSKNAEIAAKKQEFRERLEAADTIELTADEESPNYYGIKLSGELYHLIPSFDDLKSDLESLSLEFYCPAFGTQRATLTKDEIPQKLKILLTLASQSKS
jgi:hypothetical protein